MDPGTPKLQALKVLVVEDHGSQRRMALRMLSELGIEEAWEAADGQAALGVLQGMAEPPDVVLVDLEMPGMDGIEFIGHIAQRRLAIDDFGTGYSSLAQLSQIPFTGLKIDQDFVSGAAGDLRRRVVVEACLDLARKLQLEVVAEGVETVADWRMLAELGCGVAQGYLIGGAVPGEELPGAVARWQPPRAEVNGW